MSPGFEEPLIFKNMLRASVSKYFMLVQAENVLIRSDQL
jgi:hypothetical protein